MSLCAPLSHLAPLVKAARISRAQEKAQKGGAWMTISPFFFGFSFALPWYLLTSRSDTPSFPMFLLDPDVQRCLSLEFYFMYSFYSLSTSRIDRWKWFYTLIRFVTLLSLSFASSIYSTVLSASFSCYCSYFTHFYFSLWISQETTWAFDMTGWDGILGMYLVEA